MDSKQEYKDAIEVSIVFHEGNRMFAVPKQPAPVQQTCNCRWDGEVQVQQCTLHEAHVDAIHEWAGRAKAAEAKLAAQPAPTVQEPVAKKTGIGLVTGNGWDSLPVGTLLYTTPPAAPTAQEPVAWFKHGPYEDGEQLAVVFKNPHDDICYSPLGFIDSPPAAQRQWVGLTDNEKIDCASPYDSRLCCVEATEAKLKEKNQ
jgi:hypothetical protein